MLPIFIALCSIAGSEPTITFATDSFRYVMNTDATSSAFIDMATGKNYCKSQDKTPFATWIGEAAYPATSARRESDQLVLEFGAPSRTAVFRVSPRERRIEFELLSVSGEAEPRELRFASIPLEIPDHVKEPFAVSPLVLNLQVNCAEIPGFSKSLSGVTAYQELGYPGAAVAVIACSSSELRSALKDAVSDASVLPHLPTGGPWALDSENNRKSYFIDTTGTVTEKTVGDWIAMLHGLGIEQLDLHGGHAFRFGDYAPNPREYPDGRASLKKVVDALHEAGISVGLHTYAMFIAKDTPWVTPVPDPGLAKNAAFTLATEIGPDATNVPVLESTKDVSPATGFLVQNSATIQIDNELIVFKEVSKTPPYAFTKCERGAYGTTATSHAQNAKAYQLREIFGLFMPDPDSELMQKVVQSTAQTYNECGFDMMYIDALDGANNVDLKCNGKLGWHYAAKFTYDLIRQLEIPPLVEMSTFSHHLWVVRSRMGAWDACQRAPQTFVDIHMISNQEWRQHFLPTNLGWWGVFPWSGVQPKRTLADDVEYVCAKALATDSSLSLLLGFSPQTYANSYNQQRLGGIIKRYEKLRLSGAVPLQVQELLAKPGQAFHLDDSSGDIPKFRPVDFSRHDVVANNGNDTWQVENRYGAQIPRIMIETGFFAAPFDASESGLVEDFSNPDHYAAVQCNAGVSASFTSVSAPAKDSPFSGSITVTNNSAQPHRAWVQVERQFNPPLNLGGKGLGLWAFGDGSGSLLNVQLRSPRHISPARSQYYVRLDFTGWRYVELIETADYEIERYEWPFSKPRADWETNISGVTGFAYPVYHAHLDYAQVGELAFGLNDIPQGQQVQVSLGPIRSIPLTPGSMENPVIAINGKVLNFPVLLKSGQILEFEPPKAYTVCDKSGDLIAKGNIEIDSEVNLSTGTNTVEFRCTPLEKLTTNIRVTLSTVGKG
ncbi:MAG: hypothetical protein IT366_09200 [Candidatus Hydrogenedentes bacterium]|nr:hypothetical protein [Candidatus Hydrogenedentota bacterium]